MKRFEWAYYVNSYRLCVSKEREKSSSMSFVYVLTWDMNWWMIWDFALNNTVDQIEVDHTRNYNCNKMCAKAISISHSHSLSLAFLIRIHSLHLFIFFSFKKISILIPLVKTKYVNIKKISLNSVNWIHLLFWFCTSFYFLCEWKSCKYIVPFYFIFLL